MSSHPTYIISWMWSHCKLDAPKSSPSICIHAPTVFICQYSTSCLVLHWLCAACAKQGRADYSSAGSRFFSIHQYAAVLVPSGHGICIIPIRECQILFTVCKHSLVFVCSNVKTHKFAVTSFKSRCQVFSSPRILEIITTSQLRTPMILDIVLLEVFGAKPRPASITKRYVWIN